MENIIEKHILKCYIKNYLLNLTFPSYWHADNKSNAISVLQMKQRAVVAVNSS